MAFSFLKSPTEEPWDRFARRMNRALDSASVELKGKHQRYLRLGSPVKLGDDAGDIVRAPIEVRGGNHEYAIAYLQIADVAHRPTQRRLEAIAFDAAQAAMPYAAAAPDKPADVLFSYP